MVRFLVCVWVFGYGLYALHGLGEAPALAIAGGVAVVLNHLWREQTRKRRLREHREHVIEDEDLRLEVRERRAKPRSDR